MPKEDFDARGTAEDDGPMTARRDVIVVPIVRSSKRPRCEVNASVGREGRKENEEQMHEEEGIISDDQNAKYTIHTKRYVPVKFSIRW